VTGCRLHLKSALSFRLAPFQRAPEAITIDQAVNIEDLPEMAKRPLPKIATHNRDAAISSQP
jgi:hypothetical protein